MHETAVLSEILNIVLTTAKDNDIKKIAKVILHIGEFSCIQENQLRFAYDIIIKDTILEESNLVIKFIEAKAHCDICNKNFHISFIHKECPNCHKFSSDIISGYEIYVYSIEGE